ncbi:hypothetical protein [Bradyrhizobium sp. BR 10261]|uniref:hypothetical protein n=1 Tax=Bradyrhizobium sp. BR 10261 TaxID=2749992 RepID=UPI001C651116|nr:hypothetical protein [Bradyrhizobium sp. BR 10261]MBW7964797.1 hypothetical protein [Bradyrhizobium sp. BR 10261]
MPTTSKNVGTALTCHVGNVDDEVIEGLNLHRHALSFRHHEPCALSAADELCYNAAAVFKTSGLQEQHWENP